MIQIMGFLVSLPLACYLLEAEIVIFFVVPGA